jgi:WD40 repeat protein
MCASLHPDGYSLISAGLDCTVALWDVRKLGNRRSTSSSSKGGGAPWKATTPVALYNCGRSVNSAFFSSSGRYVVSTTMAHKLDVFENLHVSAFPSKTTTATRTVTIKPAQSIRHDNMTGRWLTTFQAIGHANMDVFSVGSMSQPRRVEVFDPAQAVVASGSAMQNLYGDAVTSVSSRLAFHPRDDRLILAGGNSSGRVVVFM